MSESKRSPVKRKLIFGSVVAVAMVLVLSAVGIYVSFDLPATVDLALFSEDDAGPSRSAARRGDSPGLANSNTGQPQSIPVAQPPSAEAGVRMVDIVTTPRIITFDNPGESQQLTVQGFYSDGSAGDLEGDPTATLSYTSSDSSVAQVSSDGVVTGILAAGADIVVRYGDFNAEVPVLVFGPVRRIPPIDPERVLEIDDDGSAIVLNRVMARLLPGYGPAAAQVAASIGGEVIFEFRTFPGYVIDFGAQTEEDLNQALAVLEADERVEYAYPDMLAYPSQATTGPGSPIYRKGKLSPPFPFPPPFHIPPVDNIGIGEAWQSIERAGRLDAVHLKPVVIAVVDLEFVSTDCLSERESAYPDLVKAMRGSFKYDRIKIDAEECPENLTENTKDRFHGPAVTSVLVAEDRVHKGVVTGAPEINYELLFYGTGGGSFRMRRAAKSLEKEYVSRLESIRALPYVSSLESIRALEEVERYKHQIDVVTITIEVTNDSNSAQGIVDLFGIMPDVTFVPGAGNGGKPVKNGYQFAWASQTNSNVITVGGVEVTEDEITVGGVEVTKLSFARAAKSNYGSAITVAAPYSVKVFQAQGHGEFNHRGGTSFSAPLVSGTVALMKALDPALMPVEIRKILRDTGTKIRVDEADPSKMDTWKVLNAEAAVGCILRPSFRADLEGYKSALAKALEENPEVFQNNDLDKLQSPCKTYLQPTPTPIPTPTPTPTPIPTPTRQLTESLKEARATLAALTPSPGPMPTPPPTSQEDSRWSRDGAKFLKMSFYTIPSPEPVSEFPSSFADKCTYPAIIDMPKNETRALLDAFLECIPEPLSVVPEQFHGYYVFLAFDTEATQEDFTMPVKIQLIQHNPKSGATTVFSELEVTVNHSDILIYNVTRGVFDYLIILPPQYSYEIRVLDDRDVEIVSSDFSAGLSLDQ